MPATAGSSFTVARTSVKASGAEPRANGTEPCASLMARPKRPSAIFANLELKPIHTSVFWRLYRLITIVKMLTSLLNS